MQCNVGGCSELKLLLKSNMHGKVTGVCLRALDMAKCWMLVTGVCLRALDMAIVLDVCYRCMFEST